MSILDTIENNALSSKAVELMGGLSTSKLSSITSSSSSSSTTTTANKLNYTIPQTERLFTTRSRQVTQDDNGGDRGQRTYITLLTSNPTESFNRQLQHGDSKPTSLGTSSKGVLSDAINGGTYKGYASFLLTDIRGNLDEKVQVVEVFGDAEVAYYFGRQPITMQLSGMLIDSADNNWFIEWMEMYAHVLRGTQLARNYELVKIVTPNMSLIGTITRTSWSQNSARDVDIPFDFTILVKQIIPLPVVGSGTPLSSDTGVNASKAESFKTQAGIVSQKTALSNVLKTIQNPSSTIQDYSSALASNSLLSAMGGTGESTPTQFSQMDSNVGMMGGYGSSSSSTTTSSDSGSIFANVTSNLAGIRASLFSPVYGVLSSLTKLISSTSGDISSVISSFTNPVRDILRDVRNISNQAIGVVNLINSSIQKVTNVGRTLDYELRSTLALLKKTGGIISTSPQTITSNLRDMVNAGKFPSTAAFLQNTNRNTTISAGALHTSSKLILLNSGPKHTAEAGAKL